MFWSELGVWLSSVCLRVHGVAWGRAVLCWTGLGGVDWFTKEI